MRRFDNGNIPFFFLQSKDPYVTPLSGLLNPRQPPPAPLPPRDASIGARFEADAATFSDLNNALQLQSADGTLVMHQHNVDGNYTRETTLGPWRALTYDARASAIIGCFLRLSPARSWYLTDSELLSHTMAAACLMAGCLVRRDLTAAEALVALIPLEDRRRAQTLTRDYIEQHDLWPLKDYMEPEAGLLGDTELPPAWNQPRRWPGLVKGMALWLLDVSLLDQDD